MPDLRVAITKHPIGGLKPEQVRGRAADLLDAVITGVTGGGAAGVAAGR